MSEITASVSSFASAISWSQLPDEVREAAVSALASVLSAASMGNREIDRVLGVTDQLHRANVEFPVEPLQSQGPYDTALRIGATSFSLLRDGASDVEELSCVVIPAAVVAAEVAKGTGEQLLTGVAVGMEIALRAVVSLGDTHRERGWDVVGSAGRLGATIAASVALGLSAPKLHSAIGFAATTAAGLSIAGRELRSLGAGRSSADALEAAVLAEQGLIGPPAPLEGRRGLFALVSRNSHPEVLIAALGTSWQFKDQLMPSRLDRAARALLGAEDTSAFMAIYKGNVALTD